MFYPTSYNGKLANKTPFNLRVYNLMPYFLPGIFFILFSLFFSFMVVWELRFWGWGLELGFRGWGFSR